jgi:quinol monooxygenase YgiN
MELFIFARFHVRAGEEEAAAAALREVSGPTRAEDGCLGAHYHRSIRDPRLFYVHSRWIDDEAFERHAERTHTVRFIERMDGLVDQPREVTRTRPIG